MAKKQHHPQHKHRSKHEHRYDSVAVTLHWLIAIMLISMFVLGLKMMDRTLPIEQRDILLNAHVVTGLLFLILVLVRIGWRSTVKGPPPSEALSKFSRILARIVQLSFYALMLVIPLSGWAAYSTGFIDVTVFGIVIPGLPGLVSDFEAHEATGNMHDFFSKIWIPFLILHVSGVILHYITSRTNFLKRMWYR